jgi:putative DNA primase/helicase
MSSPPQQIFPPPKHRPCYCCYDAPFLVGNNRYKEGVYYHFVETKKDANGNEIEVAVDLWICSVLRVLCIVRTDSGTEHAYLLEYIPHGETQSRRAVLAQSLLLGRGEEAMKELRALGISVLGHKAQYVRSYLDCQHLEFSHQKTPHDFWTSVKVIGWAPVGERFVLPHEVIGRKTGVWFSGKADVTQYKKSGDFSLWKSKVAGPCEGNSYLILALSCGFAGPLLEPLNIQGLGFHYHGDSTTGKSTSQVVSASVWGPPKFVRSWRTTINGLENEAANRSGTIILLDESHMIDPKALDAGIYMLLNGSSKARMNRDTTPKEVAQWRTCVLSSGERPFEVQLATAHIDHKAGQGVRIADVPVIAKFGLFDDLHGTRHASQFADALRDNAAANYGHAGPMFVERLIAELPNLALGTKLVGSLQDLKGSFVSNLNAQEERVARGFALAALAGELATDWGILPWKSGSVRQAVFEIFANWRAAQPESTKSKEHTQILSTITDGINRFSESRFSDLNWTPVPGPSGHVINEEPLIRDRLGYWDDSGGRRIYLFTPGGLKEITKGFDFNRVLRALQEAGALVKTGPDTASVVTRIPDGRTIRLYWVDPEKL